jgi:hypothetical protein
LQIPVLTELPRQRRRGYDAGAAQAGQHHRSHVGDRQPQPLSKVTGSDLHNAGRPRCVRGQYQYR